MHDTSTQSRWSRYIWAVAAVAVVGTALIATFLWLSQEPAGQRPDGSQEGVALPTHLGWVPPEATLFIQIRVAELWSSEGGQILRRNIPDLEQDVELFFLREVGVTPAETETFTLVIPTFEGIIDIRRLYRFGDFKDEPISFGNVIPIFGDLIARFQHDRFKDFPPRLKDIPLKKKFDEKDWDEKKFDEKEQERERSPQLGLTGPFAREEAFLRDGKKDENGSPPWEPMWIVTATKPAALARLRDLAKRQGQERDYKGRKYFTNMYANRWSDIAIYFVDEQTFVCGAEREIKRGLDRGVVKVATGPLTPALAKAVKNHHLVAGLAIDKKWGKDFLTELGHEPYLRGLACALLPLGEARTGVLVGDLGEQTRATLEFHFPDETTARASVDAVQDGLAMLRILGVGSIIGFMKDDLEHSRDDQRKHQAKFTKVLFEELEQSLRQATIQQHGTVVHASAVVKTSLATMQAKSKALMKPREADPNVQETPLRRRVSDDLRRIAVAVHNHIDAFKIFPPQAIHSKDGKPLLSWRVAILRFMEQDVLYRQFKLDEPWDSPHNIKLLAQMPQIYAGTGDRAKGLTPYQAILGPNEGPGATAWSARGTRVTDFLDGTVNTLLVVEAAEAVPWTKPADVLYDPNKPVPQLGGMFEQGFYAVFADASVIFLPRRIDEPTLRAIITRAGREVVPDWIFDQQK
jgi:hypothetical protein